MANIEISDLAPTGSELFFGPESYVDELASDDLAHVQGGGTPFIVVSAITLASAWVLFGPADHAH